MPRIAHLQKIAALNHSVISFLLSNAPRFYSDSESPLFASYVILFLAQQSDMKREQTRCSFFQFLRGRMENLCWHDLLKKKHFLKSPDT